MTVVATAFCLLLLLCSAPLEAQTGVRFDHGIGAMHDDDKDGVWEIIIPLKPGRYLYKFAVDWGIRWEHDQNNPLGEDDNYGGQNSVLILH